VIGPVEHHILKIRGVSAGHSYFIVSHSDTVEGASGFLFDSHCRADLREVVAGVEQRQISHSSRFVEQ
jgi:hypothetical protein